jgi:NADH:ubiquinone oxidoreductase subunit C
MFVYHLLLNYGQYLVNLCTKSVLCSVIKQDSVTLVVCRDSIVPICNLLKHHTNTQFQLLLDIVVVDYPFRKVRFEITYILLSTTRNARLILKISTDTFSAIHSVVSCYSVAS